MKKIAITATFVGGKSLGYEPNKEYELQATSSINNLVRIQRMDGSGICDYGSFVAFLKNWNNIKTKKIK